MQARILTPSDGRQPSGTLPSAICLASDGGLLTVAGNDYGFDEIFSRQVTAFGRPGDVLICLTTSGKSKNVVRALEEAGATWSGGVYNGATWSGAT